MCHDNPPENGGFRDSKIISVREVVLQYQRI